MLEEGAERSQNLDSREERSQGQQSVLKTCQKCTKIFTKSSAYQTHMKMKHPEKEGKGKEEQSHQEQAINQANEPEDNSERSEEELKPTGKKLNYKNRILEMQQNEIEDNIYAFLGELGEKNAEFSNNRTSDCLILPDQKVAGHTNYSINKVVRTPYEDPMKASKELPKEEIQKSKQKQLFLEFCQEMLKLEQKVQAEQEKWQLRDPMAPQQETQDEFSLMDIRKFLLNYPKRGLKLKYPYFSTFMLWISRICKPPAFKEFFLILGEFLAKFYQKVPLPHGENTYDKLSSFSKNFETEKNPIEFAEILKICDQKNCKKFCGYFSEWLLAFRAFDI